MGRVEDFLYLRQAFGSQRAIVGAGRALLKRISPPASEAAAPDAVAAASIETTASGFSVRQGSLDAAITDETLNYIRLLRERGRTAFNNVIDIGAHVGGFSINLARHANVAGKIYAIEPLADNFALLQRNIELNALVDKIVPINAAASFREGSALLNVNPENTGGNHLSTSRTNFTTEVTTIDIVRLFDSISGPVDLIKIDCEGWEFPILRRLGAKLSQVSAVVGESHKTMFSDHAGQRTLLERAGFKVEMFSEGSAFSEFIATR